MTDQTTTQPGVNDDVETAPVIRQDQPTERELEMERIAARNREQAEANRAAEAPPAEVEQQAEEPKLDAASQLGKQLDNGSILLDEATLSRAVIMQKVDGKEELVPAEKVFRQYQKGAAADLRLAEATRMQKEATELLAQAQTRVANATTAAERKDAAAEAEAAAGLVEMRKELFSALFSGDEEKAGKLLEDFVNGAVDAKVAGRTQPAAIDDDAVVNRIVPKLQQRLSVDSALTQLFKDYPEIHDDADMAVIADRYVNQFEADGKSRSEAILLAGEAVGAKFKIGKFAESGRPEPSATTTRDVKMEKKLALASEPQASSARASTTEAPPQTVNQTIEEMRRQRATVAL